MLMKITYLKAFLHFLLNVLKSNWARKWSMGKVLLISCSPVFISCIKIKVSLCLSTATWIYMGKGQYNSSSLTSYRVVCYWITEFSHMTHTLTGSGDRHVTSDGVNCTFIREVSQLWKLPHTENLETLLIGFLEFYSSFDFSIHAISLINGMSVPKPDHSPFYTTNPLEQGLNISKNMSHEGTNTYGENSAIPFGCWNQWP